jgi:hypothetical protein
MSMIWSPLTVLSLMIVAAGSGILSWGWAWHPDVEIVETQPVPMAALSAQSNGPMENIDDLLRTLRERPPFTRGRQPISEAKVVENLPEAEGDEGEPEIPTVQGVAVSTDQAIAIVTDEGGDRRMRRISLGSEIAGWRVTGINRESVTFTSATVQAVVYLALPGRDPRIAVTRVDQEVTAEDSTEPGTKTFVRN